MIEIIQNEAKEKKEQTVVQSRLRNLRQIGNPEGKLCIYLEDYVYTYLHRGTQCREGCVGILLGKTCIQDGQTKLFISGAVGVHGGNNEKIHIFLQEKTWEELYQTMKKYFDDLQIVGWYQLKNNGEEEDLPELEQIQKKYFDGADKVLYLSDIRHGEEAFFVHENGGILRKGGYYIYYEKNPQMQEYMIADKKPGYGVEQESIPRGRKKDDREQTIKSYRELLNEQRNQTNNRQRGHGFFYVLTGAMLFAAALYGATMLDGVEQMKKVEQTISVMAKEGISTYKEAAEKLTTEKEQKKSENEKTEKTGGRVLVENVDGGVKAQKKKEDKQKDKPQTSKKYQKEEERKTQQNENSMQKETKVSESEKEEKENGSSQATTSVVQEENIYIVKQGDSLDGICIKLYQSMSVKKQICEKNGITDANHLIVGQKLILP